MTNEPETNELRLTGEILDNINKTRKWTKFLAIVGFVFMGLFVVLAFSMGYLMESIGNEQLFPGFGVLMGGIYLVMALIYFFPVLFLYRFSTYSKKGIEEKNMDSFSKAFKYLKDHYTVIGAITAVILGLYAVMLVIGLIVLAVAGVVG